MEMPFKTGNPVSILLLHSGNVVHLLPDHSSLKGYRYGIGFRRNFIVNPLQHVHHGGILFQISLQKRLYLVVQIQGHPFVRQAETALFQIIPDDIGIIIPEFMELQYSRHHPVAGLVHALPENGMKGGMHLTRFFMHARIQSHQAPAIHIVKFKLLRQAPKFIHQGLSCGTVLDGNDQIRHLFHFLQAQGKQLFIRFHRGKPF